MSAVDALLARHGLRWELYPYRIVVASHPGLIVQAGPGFDLSEQALKGARERALTTERKRRQRDRDRDRNVTPTAQYNASVGVLRAISGVDYLEQGF
jgi:hypothetical protein